MPRALVIVEIAVIGVDSEAEAIMKGGLPEISEIGQRAVSIVARRDTSPEIALNVS